MTTGLLLRRLCLLCLVVAVAIVLPPTLTHFDVAQAQQAEERPRGGLLRFLFRQGDPVRQHRVAPPEPKRRTTPARRTSSAPVAPAEPAIVKSDTAKRILVVGDFLAGGLADGLVAAFAQNPDVVVIDRANGSSGLVRSDHYDWPGQIATVIEREQPAAVVVMIGSNDRQQMRVGDTREQPGTEPWIKEYERRATALAKNIRDKDMPLIWVGNLPFKSGTMSSDMIAFNDIYRRIVTDVGGEFVDVWDGFVDEAGNFVANGPDMNGQPAQLRSSDGINVTRQGRRKIAFYVEKPLARLLGTGDGTTAPGLPAADAPGDPSRPGEPKIIDRTPPLAIDDSDADAGTALLGASFAPRVGEARTPAERLLRQGIAPDPKPGRADDFSAPPAARVSTETTTAVSR